jgi:hypothetical protein
VFSAGPLVPLPPTTRRKPKAASLTYLEGGLEHEKRVVDTGDAIDDRDDDDEEHDDDQGEFQENGHGGGGRYAARDRTASGSKSCRRTVIITASLQRHAPRGRTICFWR